MKQRKIGDGIFLIAAVDWDRRLFDSLIPLPDGTSYNAYLVRGRDRTCLVDTVDPTMKDVLMSRLEGVDRVDYVIAHHAEQDHAGAIPEVLARYEGAVLVTTPKGKGMIADHLAVDEKRIMAVEDGQTLDLGGRTLEFMHAPWVHWPETMLTWLREDRILFTCDFFGSHLATTDLFVTDEARVYEAAKRYYAEIMMPFRSIIAKHLDRVRGLDIRVIAPSHGPLYDRPAFILDAYCDWVSSDPKNEVVLPYVSMHGSTKIMVDRLVDALTGLGVTVHQFNLAATDIGKLAISLVDAATIVIGTPTVHMGPHPAVFYAAHLANALRPKLRFASVIGSYGWSSKAVEHLANLIPNLKVEILGPVLCRGLPRKPDLEALDALAAAIARKHEENGFSRGPRCTLATKKD
jgi:flavorubredoxin